MLAGTSFWWPWGAFLAAWFVVSVLIRALFGRRRTQNFAPIAQELGFTFVPWTNDPQRARAIGTPLFQRDFAGTFRNFMTGSYAGLAVQAFDYSYSSGSAQNTTSITHTMAVYSQNVEMPPFTLEPASLAGKIIDALEHQRVELDYPPGVSQHYAVRGPDKDRIRAFFNGDLLAFVEGLDRSKQWHIEGSGKNLVVYRYRGRITPAQLKGFLQETSSIAQSFFTLQPQRLR